MPSMRGVLILCCRVGGENRTEFCIPQLFSDLPCRREEAGEIEVSSEPCLKALSLSQQ
jgi:hypothetical protein